LISCNWESKADGLIII